MTTTDPYAALREPLTGVFHEPAAADRVPNTEPERVVYVPGPGGSMVPVLADHYQPAPVQNAEPPPMMERDKWPLRMATAGGATAAVLGVVGHYGHGINEAGHGAMMAGIAVAAVPAGVGLLVGMVKGLGSKKQPINLSVSVTNNNTASARARSRARGK